METPTPLITDNILPTSLVLLYCIVNILACRKDGFFVREVAMLIDLHNERTFDFENLYRSKLSPLLFVQYFLFFGLILFAVAVPDGMGILSGASPFSMDDFWLLALCIAAPVVWFFFHFFLVRWFCFIVGGDSRVVIIERIYNAIHLLAGPASMLVFAFMVTNGISFVWASFLLTAIFIITQIVFLFSGIKIFYSGFGSICLFFVYLCALEIAPLAVLAAKLS